MSVTVTVAALAVVPVVLLLLRNRPQDVGQLPYGAGEPGYPIPPAAPAPGEVRGSAARTMRVLGGAAHTRVFWLLAGNSPSVGQAPTA